MEEKLETKALIKQILGKFQMTCGTGNASAVLQVSIKAPTEELILKEIQALKKIEFCNGFKGLRYDYS